MKKLSQLLIASMFVFGFASCGKDDPEVIDEQRDFTELNASQQQEKVAEGMQKYLNKKYKLLSKSMLNNSGGYTAIPVSECQRQIVITIPERLELSDSNNAPYLKQFSPDGACGITAENELRFSTRIESFSDYKISLLFYSVVTENINDNVMPVFFFVDENQGINTSDKYLILHEFSRAESQSGNPAKIVSEYTFQKVD